MYYKDSGFNLFTESPKNIELLDGSKSRILIPMSYSCIAGRRSAQFIDPLRELQGCTFSIIECCLLQVIINDDHFLWARLPPFAKLSVA